MPEKYGVDQIQKVLYGICDGIMIVDKLTNGQGLLSMFQFSPDLMALSTLNIQEIENEVSDLSDAERAQINTNLKAKLVLHNQVIQGKVDAGLDLINVAFSLVKEDIGFVSQVKSLFSA